MRNTKSFEKKQRAVARSLLELKKLYAPKKTGSANGEAGAGQAKEDEAETCTKKGGCKNG